MARVLEVIRRWIWLTSMQQVAGSMSTNAGVAPACEIASVKCVWNGDDLVSRPDTGRHQRKAQGVGAGIQTYAISASAEGGELLLKGLHLWPADKSAVGHDVFKNRFEFGFDLAVLDFEVKKRDLHADSGC